MKPADGPVPRLRFPAFRDAGPWEVRRLGELGELISGLTYDPTDVRDAGLLVLRSSNIKNGQIDLNDRVHVDVGVSGATLLQKDDILICVRNGSRDLIGKNALLPDGLPQCTHGAFMSAFRANDSRFVYCLFQTQQYLDQVSADLGATINSINAGNLVQYRFSVPSAKSEQHKIADCLTSLDDLIRAEGERLGALRDHKRGLMQRLFPRPGETTPRLRFPEFRDAGPWDDRSIAELVARIAQGGTPATSVPAYWNGGIPWITPAEMGDDADHHYTGATLRTISAEGLAASSAELLPAHSVIMSSRAPIGYVTINTVAMATNQGCKGLVPRANVYPEFLYCALLNAKTRLNDIGAGAGFKEISASSLAAFRLSVPKPPEQHKIADCLASLDDLIRAQGERLAALKAHKRGLMQQLFPQGPL